MRVFTTEITEDTGRESGCVLRRLSLFSVVSVISVVIISGCAAKREPSLGVRAEPAAAELKNARGLDALTPDQIEREPWSYADSTNGQIISTPHYRIYTTIDDDRILDRIPVFYERALNHYVTGLAELPLPESPMTTYLFRNRKQWQLKTQQILPDQADMFANLGRGGFTTKGTSVLYYIDFYGYTRDTFAIAAHEGWHQYTQEVFRHQLPIWLEEGVATYMEGYRTVDGVPQFQASANPERREALQSAVRRDQLISLDELVSRSPQSFLESGKNRLLRYYAQVWALTRFLAEGEDGRYRAALDALLSDAANGKLIGRMMSSDLTPAARRRRGEDPGKAGTLVIQEYFNRDLAEFERQYLDFVRQLTDRSDRPRTAAGDNVGK